MKKILLLVTCLVNLLSVNAQITFNSSYTPGYLTPNPPYLNKFAVSGYKYVFVDVPNNQINVYNTNFSVFKTITVPSSVGGVVLSTTNCAIEYLSESLFDSDNLMEYVLTITTSTIVGPYNARTYVYKENGTQLFFRDSASFTSFNVAEENAVFNLSRVHFNGTNTVMRLRKTPYTNSTIPTFLYFDLPGSIPCVECSATGTVSGISTTGDQAPVGAVFYPNPVTNQLKLKYELPKEYKNAEIKINDLQGKLIETFKVTNMFDFIYLPSDYNNGLYLYSLIVDGKTIKTEKIILNK